VVAQGEAYLALGVPLAPAQLAGRQRGHVQPEEQRRLGAGRPHHGGHPAGGGVTRFFFANVCDACARPGNRVVEDLKAQKIGVKLERKIIFSKSINFFLYFQINFLKVGKNVRETILFFYSFFYSLFYFVLIFIFFTI
jgi:hypothetical protein